MADLSFLKRYAKPIAILGLGVSGQAVAEACLESGVDFHAWDDNPERRAALQKKYTLVDFQKNLKDYAALVPAAGIKPSHPIFELAHQGNIPIWSDIDLLLYSAPEAYVIGITGTNGKSTTTALVTHIMKEAGLTVEMGGNIGRAACSLPSLQKGGVYVLELSSYQLEITQSASCNMAVILNITEDHLDWHGTVENYFASKKRIIRQRNEDVPQQVILGIDTELTGELHETLKHTSGVQVTPVSTQLPPATGLISVQSGQLFDGLHPQGDISVQKFLRGQHNFENMAVAYAVCKTYGVSSDIILNSMMSFEGLPYRQKLVGQTGNISYINDSKATNADAASRALASFDNIYWIVGGRPKQDGIDGLEKFYPKIIHTFLIGEAEELFAKKLAGFLPATRCGTLDKAVELATVMARKTNVPSTILLSPACASFDQYPNFEKRGEHFTKLVQDILKQETAA